MMKTDKLDREIQEGLDQSVYKKPTTEAVKSYQTLYKVLNNEPFVNYLPDNFADNVVSNINIKSSKRDSEAFWWFGSMIIFMLLTRIVVMTLILGIMKIETMSFISKYLPMMGLAILIIGGIQWLDKRLVKLHV